MSQKRLRKLRKIENESIVEKKLEPIKGIRQIFKENWKFLVLLLVGVIVLYFNGMHGDFVSDDYASIADSTSVTNFWSQAKLGGSDLSNWLVAIFFGVESSIPFHLFSLFLYLLICILAFVLVYLIFDRRAAIFSVILFAVLPIHVEAVSWISGKPYLLTSVMILSELVLFILYLKNGTKKYLRWFLILLPVSFFVEKVRFFSLFLLIPLYVFTFNEGKRIKLPWKKILMVATLGALVLIIILWSSIKFRVENVNGGYNGNGGVFYNPFFQYPTAIAKYLQLVSAPIDLTLYHTMYILPVWLNWLIFLSYLSAVVYFWFNDRKIFFSLAFIFLATAPSMAPIKVSWLVAERYLFLGSLGWCVFLILFFRRFKKIRIPMVILFVLMVLLYSVRVFLRNVDWQTNHKLWVVTCQVSPNSHNAWNNIGDDYDKLADEEATEEGKLKQYYNAIKGFTQSVTVKENYADAYHNRANIFYKIGRYDLARDSYETALYYGPNLYQSYYSLIQIDLIEQDYESAINHLNRLDEVMPNDPQVYYAAAVVYANMGRLSEAASILEQLVAVNPGWEQAENLLIQVEQGLGTS